MESQLTSMRYEKFNIDAEKNATLDVSNFVIFMSVEILILEGTKAL